MVRHDPAVSWAKGKKNATTRPFGVFGDVLIPQTLSQTIFKIGFGPCDLYKSPLAGQSGRKTGCLFAIRCSIHIDPICLHGALHQGAHLAMTVKPAVCGPKPSEAMGKSVGARHACWMSGLVTSCYLHFKARSEPRT